MFRLHSLLYITIICIRYYPGENLGLFKQHLWKLRDKKVQISKSGKTSANNLFVILESFAFITAIFSCSKCKLILVFAQNNPVKS